MQRIPELPNEIAYLEDLGDGLARLVKAFLQQQ